MPTVGEKEERFQAGLGDLFERFVEFELSDPRALIEILRSDLDFAAAVVRADTRPQLRRWFREVEIDGNPTGGWVWEPAHSGALGEAAVGVEWTWSGIHAATDADGEPLPEPFNQLTPTGVAVEVRGFTVLDVDDALGFALHRHVDWAGLYAQLGLTVNWRTPVRGSYELAEGSGPA